LTGDAYLAANYGKFAVTQETGSAWTIDSAGKLAQNVASRNNGAVYYTTLAAAITAATNGTDADHPDIITILHDITLDSAQTITGGHVKLTVPANTTRTIKRGGTYTGSLFTVTSGFLTLEGSGTGSMEIDGGAVWTGGTAAVCVSAAAGIYSAMLPLTSTVRLLNQTSSAILPVQIRNR
jgi:hypothetical protein